MNTINWFVYYFDLVLAYIVYAVTYIYENFREFSFVIKVAAISLTISIGLVLYCVCRVFIRKWKRSRWQRVMDRLEKRWGDGVAYVLSADAKPNLSRQEVLEALDLKEKDATDPKSLLKNTKERLQFSRLVYRKRISEDAVLGRRHNLHVLLSIFGVQEFLEEQVIKGKESLKGEALHMMRAFKLSVNQWVANQMMASKRKRLRRLAMYASIMSSSNTDLQYFETKFFDHNCCTYDEIQLGYVLRRRQLGKRKMPNLAYLAHQQQNPGTQAVFVRLMRQFNQAEYCNELEDLFTETSDRELTEEIARTWGYLNYGDGETLLADALLTQPDDTKVCIMHALARMNTGRSLASLEDGYRYSTAPNVRFEALRCLYNYGPAGQAKLAELELSATTEADKALFSFFHNPITLPRMALSEDDIYTPQFGENIYSVA